MLHCKLFVKLKSDLFTHSDIFFVVKLLIVKAAQKTSEKAENPIKSENAANLMKMN